MVLKESIWFDLIYAKPVVYYTTEDMLTKRVYEFLRPYVNRIYL